MIVFIKNIKRFTHTQANKNRKSSVRSQDTSVWWKVIYLHDTHLLVFMPLCYLFPVNVGSTCELLLINKTCQNRCDVPPVIVMLHRVSW